MTTDEDDAPGVAFLIHGESKVGKTYLGATSPPPVLILDAEGGTRFLKHRKVKWDGKEAPPEPSDWEVCIVTVRDFDQIRTVYQWLASGKHPFKSVVIDSLSETQQRCIDALAGTNQMAQQQWGELLRSMSSLVRQFRDLLNHPTNPLQAVVFLAMTRESQGRKIPYVQGQLSVTLPYYIDVVGYYYIQLDEQNQASRKLLTSAHALFEAGDRTGMLGIGVTDPSITTMLSTIHQGGSA
jgi:hypothetical protein